MRESKKYSFEQLKKRNGRINVLYNIVGIAILLIIVGIAFLVRFFIIGGEFNECFWAQDVGTCLALRNK